MTKVVVDYSGAETEEINPFELMNKPAEFLIISLNSNIFCLRCRKHLIIHKSKKCVTFSCGCECRIIYPKNKNGVKVSTVIRREEHNPNHKDK